jgi:hypothetical protein
MGSVSSSGTFRERRHGGVDRRYRGSAAHFYAIALGGEVMNSDHRKQNPEYRAHGVRYQIRDVARAIDFYTRLLGFKLEQQAGTAFARVYRTEVSACC